MINRIRALLATPQVAGMLAFAAVSWGAMTITGVVEQLRDEAARLDTEVARRRAELRTLRDDRLAAIRDMGKPAPDDETAAAAYRDARDAQSRQGAVCLTCAGPWPCMSHPDAAGVNRSVRFGPAGAAAAPAADGVDVDQAAAATMGTTGYLMTRAGRAAQMFGPAAAAEVCGCGDPQAHGTAPVNVDDVDQAAAAAP